jgi:hypothetical protein
MFVSLKLSADFCEGVCAPSNATADFRDPPPLLDSRINPREPQSNATEHFNGQQHPKLGGIDASGAVRVREHSHEVAPKRRSVASRANLSTQGKDDRRVKMTAVVLLHRTYLSYSVITHPRHIRVNGLA